jgi:hypothetical protein
VNSPRHNVVRSVLKQTIQIASVLCVLSVLVQSQDPEQSTKRRANEAAIEVYCKELDAFRKSNPNRARFFGDVASSDSKTPKWKEFKSRKVREAAATGDNLFDVADVWSKDGKVVVAEFGLGSPSGDWSQLVTYYFRNDGTLAKMRSSYAGFNLNPFNNKEDFGARLVQTRIYDTSGNRLSKTLQCFQLGQKGRQRKCSGDYSHYEGEVYKKVERLPIYRLL